MEQSGGLISRDSLSCPLLLRRIELQVLFLLQLDRTLWLVFPLSIFFPFLTMDPLLPSRGEREGWLGELSGPRQPILGGDGSGGVGGTQKGQDRRGDSSLALKPYHHDNRAKHHFRLELSGGQFGT